MIVNYIEFIFRSKKDEPLEMFSLHISETSMQKLLDHLNQLSQIRMDHHTRLAFIFQDDALNFIGLFRQCRSRMEQFLSDLEESAVQLDRMKKGASISTVTGSSLGIAGGVLSIVGIALAPVTAGVSLTLTLTGVVLGVTSGVNSLVTGVTETAVNFHFGKNAQNIFREFMNDTNKMQCCLEQASVKRVKDLDVLDIFKAEKVLVCAGGVAKGINAMVYAASAVKVLKSEQMVPAATKMGLQALPDIGKLAKGTQLALSKSARAGFITVNALFIGLDFLFICKDSISLAKGSKSETSQLIRSRATLWKSELEAWQQIYDSLCIGIEKFRKSQILLDQPFLP
ncbi:apolipoprotein L3-like [Misgurnus anguillicaudatus]|uniref:apolipoprotein L3-like n=1 Tax=Misgurnus anguillicaudatus TaxID=75329 RepID=UPI003CCF5335